MQWHASLNGILELIWYLWKSIHNIFLNLQLLRTQNEYGLTSMVDIKFIAVKLKTKPTKHFLISYTKQNRCFMIGIGGRGKWFRSTGWQQSFYTISMWICCSLVHMNKNCRKLQILIPTFSENFVQINQVWPQLQPKTWSEAILKMYKSLHHFIIDSLQKCILEAVIDCLEIQSWLKGEIVPNWMSILSMAVSNVHFWRLSMRKWSKPE